ncbi:MAG: hypothetical protein CME61_02865, partial [Halobacteriovoraceae bacterium]|nr:hypothetical protein [Halobacteriovoraceae bacterium]
MNLGIIFSFLALTLTTYFWLIGASLLAFLVTTIFLIILIIDLINLKKNAKSKIFLLGGIKQKIDLIQQATGAELSLMKKEIKTKDKIIGEMRSREINTLQLSEEQIVEAEYLLKKQKKQKRLLKFIGHDLKAPFQNILSFLSLPESASYLNHIKNNAENGLTLINQLLNQKEETGLRRALGKYKFINNFVDETLESLRLKNVTTTYNPDFIRGIPLNPELAEKILRPTLQNLLSNAFKYGDPNISIKLRFSIETDPRLLICEVINEGKSIPEEMALISF